MNWKPISFWQHRTTSFFSGLVHGRERGKSIRLAVVAANDLWDGILRAATALKSSTIVLGHSAKETTEEQARQIGDGWEQLGDQKTAV